MRRKEPEKAEKLAQCAFKLFSERGIGKVNMDAIAAEAGVTKGSVYHHFKSKQEVILAACNYYYDRWRQYTLREIDLKENSLERLAAAIAFSVRSCLIDSKNRIFTLEILTLSLYDEQVRQSWARFYDSARLFYIKLVRAAIAEGAMKSPACVEEKVNLMLCAMEGIKQQAHFEKHICSRKSEENICRQLMDMLQS